jgi:hypothetical protein
MTLLQVSKGLKLNINERFKVSLVLGGGGFSAVNFGAALCIAKPVEGVEKDIVHTYKNQSELLQHVAADSEAYRMSQRWFQNGGGAIKYLYVDVVDGTELAKKDWFYAVWYERSFVSEANIKALADAAKTNSKLLFHGVTGATFIPVIGQNDSVNLTQTTGTDYYPFGALAAKAASVNYAVPNSSITLENKIFAGVESADDAISDQITAFVNLENGSQTRSGYAINTTTLQPGMFISDRYDLAALASAIQTQIANGFSSVRKYAYSPEGYSEVLNVGRTALMQFYKNDVLAGGEVDSTLGDMDQSSWLKYGFLVLSQPSDVGTKPADGKFPPFRARVNLAGAGTKIDATIEVIL